MDYVLRLNLGGPSVTSAVTVPSGRSLLRFYSTSPIFARSGDEDAEVPTSVQVTDGTAAFPFAESVQHTVPVAGGERFTFVTSDAAGVLHVSCE